MSAEYGRTFKCFNLGPFLMREIVRPGEPTLYVDNSFTLVLSAQQAIDRGWVSRELISLQAEPVLVDGLGDRI